MSRWMSKSILGIALAACLLLPDLSAADDTAVTTAANAGDWGNFEVGSTIVHIELSGTEGERRPMDVLLWYPADKEAYQTASLTVYTSRLNGVPLDPARWDPLSWTVTAERARDGVPIDAGGPSFPLIIMSHGAAGEPHSSAPTLERLASHGYVIAAPWHNGDTQDDRRIDIINTRAGRKIVPCFDGGPSPCLDGVQKAVQNRVLDIAAIIDNVSYYFGDRVDTSRVGLLGQSRGSVTALAEAGGSTPWNIAPEPRVNAIMLLAIGTRTVTFSQDVGKIPIPSLLVAGKIDRNTPMAISVDAFNVIGSEQKAGDPEALVQKALVILERAEHRVYGSAYCAQTQAAGAIFQVNARAIGEELTLENLFTSPAARNSGTPLDWCFYDTFTNPVDIRPVIEAMTGFQVMPNDVRLDNPCEILPEFPCQIRVPRQLDLDTSMRLVLELAVTFFDAVLVKEARPGVHFKQYLSPKFMLIKEGETVSYAESESFQGSAVECDDPGLPAPLDVACGE